MRNIIGSEYHKPEKPGTGSNTTETAVVPAAHDPNAAEVNPPIVNAAPAAGTNGTGTEAPGIAAREVLGTPVPVVAGKGNPYDKLFESIHFSVSSSDKVNTADRTGIVSRKLAAGIAVYTGGYAGVPVSVYIKRSGAKGKPYLELTFFGNLFQNSMIAMDAQSKADLADWKRRAIDGYDEWRKAQGPQGAAVKVGAAIKEVEGMDDLLGAATA